MSDPADLPEPDRVEGAPHPRETARLFGHDAAEATFLGTHATGRLHHAWLITGPRGVGKATLAWRIARFLLAEEPADAGLFGAPPPAENLDISPDHPVARRILAGSEGRLFVLRRGPNASGTGLSDAIRVDEARALKNFLQLSSADGGQRAVIVDAADEMNVQAANAILKLLEEPPARTTLLLISHQPAGLLPTIRSRCRELRLAALGAADMAAALAQAGIEAEAPERLAELSGGSVGEAVRLSNLEGMAFYESLVAAFRPRLDRPAAIALGESLAGRQNAARYEMALRLIDILLARAARAAACGLPREAAPGETDLLAKWTAAPGAALAWAEQAERIGARGRHGRAVNLDPAALILDMLLAIDQTAAQLGAR